MDKTAGYFDPVARVRRAGRKSDIDQAYTFVERQVDEILERFSKEPLALDRQGNLSTVGDRGVEVPKDFVDAVMQIRPQELTFELLQK